ncbi:glycosyltransferase family 2 protein [Micropruina sonneratiae]|uniref:glycosyltransferase family 2 protein n=1 Tax=Micropruina sonneratiae TaxID=2986940 RepID=UPI002225CCD5|nr:glycosyltransferase family 2 protein [Micropruina sp. KQZ13P-5]MCW3157015.1 glycosyltransferase family 2 protein [Micropruina sp. KQZ13P-5]
MSVYPAVSYVMPVLNEEGYLADAVAAVLSQDYPAEAELVIALGASTDDTTAIAHRLAAADSRIVLVDNPVNDIPVGLNLAIAASRNPIVVRVDAHAELPEGYTRTMVDLLNQHGAVNVGGVMHAKGRTPFQSAVARAYNSPWGLGGGQYHGAKVPGPSDSAYLGVFRREVLDEVGGYDETLRRAEDWELNSRIRAAGHLIWYTPDVAVTYWPRATPASLRRQMFATGVWRGHLVREQGGTPPKYLAPPLTVLALGASAVVGVAQACGALQGRASAAASIVHVAPVAYAGGLMAVSVKSLGATNAKAALLNVAVLGIMHLSWGAGFLRGLVAGAHTTVDTSRVRGKG